MAKAGSDATELPAGSIDARLCARLPDDLKARLLDFLEQNCSGNVQLNIEVGELRGYHVNDVVRCSKP